MSSTSSPLWEAVTLMGMSRFEEAIALLSRITPASAEEQRAVLEQQGVALLAEGEFERGLTALKEAGAKPWICGPAAFCAGDTALALATYHALLPTASIAEAPILWLRTAHAHAAEGQDAEAEECLRKALSLKCGKATRAQIHQDLAVLLAKRGSHAEAIQHMKRALEYSQDQTEASVVHAGLQALELGTMLLREQMYDRALQALGMAKSLLPPEAVIHHSLGAAHLGCKDYKRAVSELEQALELCPSSVASRKLLAIAHGSVGEHDAAIQHLRAALGDHPDSVYLLTRLAESLLVTARTTEAEAIFAKLLLLDPSSDDVRRHLRALRFVPKTSRALVVCESASLPKRLRITLADAGFLQASIFNLHTNKANPENIMSHLKEMGRAQQSEEGGNLLVYLCGAIKRPGGTPQHHHALSLSFGSGDIAVSTLLHALRASGTTKLTVAADLHVLDGSSHETAIALRQLVEAELPQGVFVAVVGPPCAADAVPPVARQLCVGLGGFEGCAGSPGCETCGEFSGRVFEAGAVMARNWAHMAMAHLRRDGNSACAVVLTLGDPALASIGLPLKF